MYPSVSIILPNLNTDLTFLKERIDSITDQTFIDWECIVIDGYSKNGSWELLQATAKKDCRFKCYQFPKEGIYTAWNSGIGMAKGKYIYIAPSDDTMLLTLLTKMVAKLEQHPDCGLAHCNLTIIDEQGNRSKKKNWDDFVFAKFDNLKDRYHIRKAPYDGIIYCGVGVVYTSITQLLLKKEVFNKLGFFLTDQGPTADVEWGMRATFAFNTLHIPDYLATWRIHSQQATDDTMLGSAFLNEKMAYYVSHAITTVKQKRMLMFPVNIKKLQYHYLHSAWLAKFRKSHSLLKRFKITLVFSLRYPLQFAKEMADRVLGRQRLSNFQLTKKLIGQYKLEKNIILLQETK